MHHSDIDIAWALRVVLSEEIPANLTKGKEFPDRRPAILFVIHKD